MPNINQRDNFYAGRNPYHDYLIKALKHFGFTEFTNKAEFWTLGAKEWHEWNNLKNHFQFGPKSYHNIDKEEINPNNDPRVQAHYPLDFFQMHKIWKHPAVINFDSTNIVTKNNEMLWGHLVSLVIKGMDKSPKISLNVNLMTSYARIRTTKEEQLMKELQIWEQMLRSNVEYHGYKYEIFHESVWTPMEGRNTPMLSLHFLISAT